MVWDAIEGLAMVGIVVGLLLALGPWGLVGGSAAVLATSLVVNGRKERK